MREARLHRVRRLRERRQEGGRQHSFETIGSMRVCKKCNCRALTAKGKQKLELQACDPAAHRLNQRARDKARRQGHKQGAEVCEEALDAIAPVGPQGHRLGHIGPLTFCLKCSCYSVHVGRGLLDQCQGPPRTNSSADNTRRYNKKLLMAGKHPGTRKLVEGSTQDQLDALIQWSQAEERADLLRKQLDACPAPRVAQPSVPAVAEVAAVAAATPPSSGPPRRKRCSGSSSSNLSATLSSVKWPRLEEARRVATQWQVGSIEAAEAEADLRAAGAAAACSSSSRDVGPWTGKRSCEEAVGSGCKRRAVE